MAIQTVTGDTAAQFAADHAARIATKAGNPEEDPRITRGRRAGATDDAAVASAAATKAAADKLAADTAAAEKLKGDKKGDADVNLDDLHAEPDAEKKKTGLQKRFSEITAEKKAAEAKAAEAERKAIDADARAAALQAQIDAAAKAAKVIADAKPAPTKPKKEDFKTPEEFVTAMETYAEVAAEYKVEKRLQEKAEADAKAALERANQKVVADWNKRVIEARKEVADYDEVTTDSPVQVTNELQAAIMESDVGPHILYWLAQHPGRAAELRAMTVLGMQRAFGRLEQQVADDLEGAKTSKADKAKADADAADAAKAAAKKGEAAVVPGMTVTDAKPKAPEPISRVSGTGSTAVGASGLFDDKGNFTGTPKQWRQLRAEGKIN